MPVATVGTTPQSAGMASVPEADSLVSKPAGAESAATAATTTAAVAGPSDGSAAHALAHVATENSPAAAAATPVERLHQELMTNASEEPAISPLVDIRHIAVPAKPAGSGAAP